MVNRYQGGAIQAERSPPAAATSWRQVARGLANAIENGRPDENPVAYSSALRDYHALRERDSAVAGTQVPGFGYDNEIVIILLEAALGALQARAVRGVGDMPRM